LVNDLREISCSNCFLFIKTVSFGGLLLNLDVSHIIGLFLYPSHMLSLERAKITHIIINVSVMLAMTKNKKTHKNA